MVREHSFILTVQSKLENGRMGKNMVKVLSLILMEKSM